MTLCKVDICPGLALNLQKQKCFEFISLYCVQSVYNIQ